MTLLDSLARIIARKEEELGREIFLISDEPYQQAHIRRGRVSSHLPIIIRRSIVATSHSKDLGLAGDRIGYIAIHPDYEDREELADGLIFCTRTLGFVNAPALIAAHRGKASVCQH